MTLNKPNLNLIKVFDAKTPYTFTFIYRGDQVFKNRLIIRENTSNEIVYDQIQEKMRLEHTIPEDTLINNTTYNIQVQVFDAFGNSSELSDLVLFTCRTTPILQFVNLPEGNISNSANLIVNIEFLQPDGDSLKEYKYYLYDINKTEIYVSNSFYSLENNIHTYYGLGDMETYFIRVLGTTSYGFDVDTGYIRIAVMYDTVPPNIVVSAENKCGQIVLSTNIIFVEYELDNDNYKLENGELTLIDNKITYFVEGVGDFSLVIIGRNIPIGTFAKVNCIYGSANIALVYVSNNIFCRLSVEEGNNKYVIYKRILGKALGDCEDRAITDTDKNLLRTISGKYKPSDPIVFEVHRKNNLYSLNAYYR